MIKKLKDFKIEETISINDNVETKNVTTFKNEEERESAISKLLERSTQERDMLIQEVERNNKRIEFLNNKISSINKL